MTNANLISRYRAVVQTMLKSFADCRALEDVMTSQGGASMFVDTDFTGDNADLTAAEFSSIIVSREAIETFTTDNFHYANLNKALT